MQTKDKSSLHDDESLCLIWQAGRELYNVLQKPLTTSHSPTAWLQVSRKEWLSVNRTAATSDKHEPCARHATDQLCALLSGTRAGVYWYPYMSTYLSGRLRLSVCGRSGPQAWVSHMPSVPEGSSSDQLWSQVGVEFVASSTYWFVGSATLVSSPGLEKARPVPMTIAVWGRETSSLTPSPTGRSCSWSSSTNLPLSSPYALKHNSSVVQTLTLGVQLLSAWQTVRLTSRLASSVHFLQLTNQSQ